MILGRVGEQLAPLVILLNYGVSPKDLRFLGTPIDYVAFKGLSSGEPKEILFVEVKSGKETVLTPRERRIRELVESGRVRWLLVHVPTELERVKEALARNVD